MNDSGVRACFRIVGGRRVRARGLRELAKIPRPCRPGPLTGRFLKHALRLGGLLASVLSLNRLYGISAVPSGLGPLARLNPALKGWAIINCPSGTWSARYVGEFVRRHTSEDAARVHLLPLPARNERGEGWGEGNVEQECPSSPCPGPKLGARLWAKPQSQRHRRQERVGLLQRVLIFGRPAADPSDTAALRPSPPAAGGEGEPFALSTLLSLRRCFRNRPVRGPGLQRGEYRRVSCRPRALTRRFRGFSKHALGSTAMEGPSLFENDLD